MATKRKSGRQGPPKKLSLKQVARLLLDHEMGEPWGSIARGYGVSRASLAHWRPYIGLNEDWLRRVRTLERTNWVLTKKVARLSTALKASTGLIKRLEPRVKRRSLYSAALQAGFSMSREEANKVCGLSHGVGHQGIAQEGDHRLVGLMRKYIEENPGVGFRGMFSVLLRDEHCSRNHARALYQQARLQRRWRKRPVATPARVVHRIVPAHERDQAWSMDYLIDALPTGKRYYVLSVIDDYSRECVLCRVFSRATAQALVQSLDSLRVSGRLPSFIRTDNGGQFKSTMYINWTDRHSVNRKYSRPWHWTDNIHIERFNRTLRDEVFNWYKFRSLVEVQRMLDDWRTRYNMARPHMALHGLSPLQFVTLYANP
ncbi:IS3 family transposase [Pseudoxanthomonas putridarboris]|uniref:IS3 family transposase n=1 Tax=Pseudoxanthomonas putridarboris TaxID=752605 RepID=A0ABU9IY01_9GAMM